MSQAVYYEGFKPEQHVYQERIRSTGKIRNAI